MATVRRHVYLELVDPAKNADKYYLLVQLEDAGSYETIAQYGRRPGTASNQRKKWYTGPSVTQADQAFDRQRDEKLREGYRNVTPVPSHLAAGFGIGATNATAASAPAGGPSLVVKAPTGTLAAPAACEMARFRAFIDNPAYLGIPHLSGTPSVQIQFFKMGLPQLRAAPEIAATVSDALARKLLEGIDSSVLPDTVLVANIWLDTKQTPRAFISDCLTYRGTDVSDWGFGERLAMAQQALGELQDNHIGKTWNVLGAEHFASRDHLRALDDADLAASWSLRRLDAPLKTKPGEDAWLYVRL